MLAELTASELSEWIEFYTWESEGCPVEKRVTHQTPEQQLAFWKVFAPVHNARVEALKNVQ